MRYKTKYLSVKTKYLTFGGVDVSYSEHHRQKSLKKLETFDYEFADEIVKLEKELEHLEEDIRVKESQHRQQKNIIYKEIEKFGNEKQLLTELSKFVVPTRSIAFKDFIKANMLIRKYNTIFDENISYLNCSLISNDSKHAIIFILCSFFRKYKDSPILFIHFFNMCSQLNLSDEYLISIGFPKQKCLTKEISPQITKIINRLNK